MTIRILWVQAKADLTLRTLVKIMLRVVTTTFTKLPISSHTTLRTTQRIMKDVLLTTANTFWNDSRATSMPRSF